VYVIYLFREDMSGVYLTLNQGITKEKKLLGTRAARSFVRERALKLRGLCDGLADFSAKDDIDLHSDARLSFEYQLGTITSRFYETGEIPADTILISDLERILEVYDTFLKQRFSSGDH
jgi:hypothetical protein